MLGLQFSLNKEWMRSCCRVFLPNIELKLSIAGRSFRGGENEQQDSMVGVKGKAVKDPVLRSVNPKILHETVPALQPATSATLDSNQSNEAVYFSLRG